ncbi:MAG TPA: DEAD/DEAH box helicase [Gemmatimonadaceae bacterium]|nr:DEAD/DEAH box helicase [Gemmatimonadaceae bacterium]
MNPNAEAPLLRSVRDPYLPPDHDAFIASGATRRIIVIAPTRAACETIELAFTLDIETLLWREHGHELAALAEGFRDEDLAWRPGAVRRGFGIVAGTGTGKTLSIRPIAQVLLGEDRRPAAEGSGLRVGVINREREATPESPTWNVVIVTTGIARRWFQDGDIRPQDTIVVDEIHQTSAELELCLALGKRVGCRFIWLSATVDPAFYRRYLDAAAVVQSSAFDPAKAADVQVVQKHPVNFLDDRFLQRVMRERRGVGVFLPTRAAVEEAATSVAARYPRMTAQFYHGGEPIRVIRPFLDGTVEKPYLLAMTAAGQSALNVQGLDTVVIDDTRFANLVENGRNVLTRVHLGANEILQMAGRVHGRVAGGRVFILSDRDIAFSALRPTEPEFQLAGDSQRVALTCAALGVRADELELPVPLDRPAYRRALELLEARGIVENGRLTKYGRAVEAMPVDRPWAELLVHCDDTLLPYVAVMAGIESLHRMTREDRDLAGLIVRGSDNLTAYNVYAEAFTTCGYVGDVYGLPRHLFDESIERWAEHRGVLVKSLEDAALAMASIYRSTGTALPTVMPQATDAVERRFVELLAQLQPFDLVIDETTAWGEEARVSKTSVAGTWGAISGTLRYFADKFGVPRAAIEGTNVPLSLVRRFATSGAPTLVFDARHKHAPLALERRVSYFGFELEREREAVHEFPPGLEAEARHVLAAALARGEARHAAVPRNQQAVEQVREAWRRSGGRTPRLGMAELTAWYEAQLGDVRSLHEFRALPLRFDADAIVPRAERERLAQLPGAVEIRGRNCPIHYEVEEDGGTSRGVLRIVLPEKVARGLVAEELPAFDRPARFTVTRGARGAVKAGSLDELHEALERPYTDDEAAAAMRRNPRGGRGGHDDRTGRRDGGHRGGDHRTGGFGRPGEDRRGGKGSHRPGSPAGRGKRRGRDR